MTDEQLIRLGRTAARSMAAYDDGAYIELGVFNHIKYEYDLICGKQKVTKLKSNNKTVLNMCPEKLADGLKKFDKKVRKL